MPKQNMSNINQELSVEVTENLVGREDVGQTHLPRGTVRGRNDRGKILVKVMQVATCATASFTTLTTTTTSRIRYVTSTRHDVLLLIPEVVELGIPLLEVWSPSVTPQSWKFLPRS